MELLSLSIQEYTLICGSFSLLIGLSSRVYSVSKDPSRSQDHSCCTGSPNPYFVAYITGGKNELLRIMLIALTIKNYLQFDSSRDNEIFSCVSKPPDTNSLMSVEQEMLDYCRETGPLTKKDSYLDFSSLISKYASILEDQSDHKIYFLTASENGLTVNTILSGLLFFAASVMFQAKVNQDFSWWFLSVAFLAWILLIKISTLGGLNNLGERYLAFLKDKYSLSKYSDDVREDDKLVLIITASLFGGNALKNTSFAYFIYVFKEIYVSTPTNDYYSTSTHDGCGGCGGCGCG